MRKFSFILLIFVQALSIKAQEILSLQQAVETALKNNYSITIAKTQSDIAKKNNTLGNAGFSPSLSVNANGSYSNNNTKQEYSSGLSINSSGVVSNGLNSGLVLNWTIFDGLKMFATHNKLKELQAMGELNAKVEIENAVSKIMLAYYDIVKQQQLIKATNEAIRLNEERLKIAQKKFDIGSASKLDVLQAKVDLNAQRSNLLKQKIAVDNLKITLNQLMSAKADNQFSVNDTIVLSYKPGYEELKSSVTKNNNSLLISQRNIEVANYTSKEINAIRLPQVGVNANYNFARTKNQIGFVLLNQNLGFNTGFTASWMLFNGLKNRTAYKNAQLQQYIAKVQYDQAQNTVEASILKAWYNLQSANELLKLEEENISIARENVMVAMERFKLGNGTSVELMTAQKSIEDANGRLITARYDAKAAEIELMRLNGALVK